MTIKHVFKTGELIEFETGEYSDHQTNYPIRVIAKFNIREQLQLYIAQSGIDPKGYGNDHEAFIAYLVINGFVEEPDEQLVYRVWLGSYGKFCNHEKIGA